MAAIEEKQKKEERRVEALMEELKQEIQELRKWSVDSEPQIPVNSDQSDDTKQVIVVSSLCLMHTLIQCERRGRNTGSVFVLCSQDIVSTMCLSEMKDWSKVMIETDPCIGVTRQALSDVMEKMKAEVQRLSKSGEKSIIHRLSITGFHKTFTESHISFSVAFLFTELKRIENNTGKDLATQKPT